MKQTLLIIALLFTSGTFAFSQNNSDWTKDDRTGIFDDCITTLTKFKNITQEQKESIALCYLDEVTKKYTKKEYQAKIDIEIKRIQDATILQCSKNIGVDLSIKKEEIKPIVDTVKKEVAPKKTVNEGNFTKDDLVGVWKDNNSKMFFNADGSFIVKMNNGESFGSTYYIDEKKDIIIDSYGVLLVKQFDGKNLSYQQTVISKKNIISKKKVTTESFTAVKMD